MKILYGVVGEGMGHAIRSRVVLDHLLAQGHEVQIIASGRAVDYLERRFQSSGVATNRIHGLHIIAEENHIRMGKTVWSNILQGTAAIPQSIAAYFDLIEAFRPEVVISDFESWTYLYGKANRIPVLSVDNQQIINRCTLPEAIIGDEQPRFQLTKAFVKSKLPFCDHYLITTFFYPPIRKEHTTLYPPILRPEILGATTSRGDHLLVYQTAEGHHSLVDALAKSGFECRVYGMKRNLTEELVEGSLRYMPFDETRFIEDMASARAIVAGGGFTTMSEAVYMRKPMLSIPMAGQFEQVLNARFLAFEGFGMAAASLAEVEEGNILPTFVQSLPAFEERLASYSQDGNRLLLRALDEHLDRAAAGV